ncbi:MAG: Ig-like domain-containing protein, partial [Devosia sp.]
LLANDTDPDTGATQTFVSVANGTGGTVSLAGGNVTFTPTANFNGAATFTYLMTDGIAQSTGTVTVNVTAVNDAPTITSDGIGPLAAISVAENATAVTTITSTDTEGTARTYSLVDGADQGKFTINATTGVLAFIAGPDFETPADAGGNNIYDVIVRASDGSLSDDQAISVTVTNVAGHTIKGHKTNADKIDGTKPVGNTTTGEEDKIDGRGGNDTIKALGGNDTVKGGLGVDNLDGGTGIDTVDFSDQSKGVVLTLNGSKTAIAKVGGLVEDTLKNFENITGGKSNDTLTGDKQANILKGGNADDQLDGGKANDSLDGGKGNDTLIGGLGTDTLMGGANNDIFVFNARLGVTNVDIITDFVHDADRIQLDDAIFKAIGPTLEAGEFYAKAGATAAKQADDRIIYNKTTGDLYYDADGTGIVTAVLFATLTAKPGGVDGGDFIIV